MGLTIKIPDKLEQDFRDAFEHLQTSTLEEINTRLKSMPPADDEDSMKRISMLTRQLSEISKLTIETWILRQAMPYVHQALAQKRDALLNGSNDEKEEN